MRVLSFTLLIALAAASLQAAPRVVFVDNRVTDRGAGTAEHPFASLAQGAFSAHENDVIYVAETEKPYLDGVTLRKGQKLIGSAYGLDRLSSDLHVEFVPPQPTAFGPTILGPVVAGGDNLIAGVTLAALAVNAPAGPVSVAETWFRPARNMIGVAISTADVPVTFNGGGLHGVDESYGVMIGGGQGDVTFDGFEISGNFNQAIGVMNRTGGHVLFRGRVPIDVANAINALTIGDCAGSVEFEVPLRVSASRRALSIAKSKVRVAGPSRLSATEGDALEIRDAAVEAAFETVSAANGGITIDKLRGKLAIAGGIVGKIIDVTQSDGVRLSNMTAAGLHLRHVSHAELEEVTVNGAARVSNIEDVTFAALHVKGAMALDEAKQSVKFSRCTFDGGAVELTQQFFGAKVSFVNCTFTAAPLRAQASGGALDLTVTDSRFDQAIAVTARANARLSFKLGRTTAPAVEVTGPACAELFGNSIADVKLGPAVSACR